MEIDTQWHGVGTRAKTARTARAPSTAREQTGFVPAHAPCQRTNREPSAGRARSVTLAPGASRAMQRRPQAIERRPGNRPDAGTRAFDGHCEGAGTEQDGALGPVVEAGADDRPRVVDVGSGADRPAGAVRHERVEVEERRDRFRHAAEVDDDRDLPVLGRVRCIAHGLPEGVDGQELRDRVARQRRRRARLRSRPDRAERAAVGGAVADDEPVRPHRVRDARCRLLPSPS